VKIYASSDHAGVKLRGRLVERLRKQGHQVVDLGPQTGEPSDYPDPAAHVGRAVRADRGSVGLLVCGSGIGVGIAANKLPGIRAAAPWNVESARLSRAHNDANVLCLGERLIPDMDADAITDAWLAAGFEGGRHARRVAKITALERTEAMDAIAAAEAGRLEERGTVARIWSKEPLAFTSDPAHDPSIRNRLGWLTAPDEMAAKVGDLEAFAADVRRAGFTNAVLLGMGGSSLCPEVLALTFDRGPNRMPVLVLDNTDPAAVLAVERAIDPVRTLFIVASKSGGTIEIRSFQQYFWDRALARCGGDAARAGAQFVAITDPGTKLEALAREHRYRAVFSNPADVGGRYSALTYFGLVPAALLGIDLKQMLERARRMADRCRETRVADNPGAQLGSWLGALAGQGRDKLTLFMSPEIASLGSWIEQLVAESTGKIGKGILPVDGEPIAAPERYGDDRVFVALQLQGGRPAAEPAALDALRAAGHPVLELRLDDRLDLGAEFFRWEFATAVAGAALGLNPFDEPNVTEAKEATGRLLESYARDKTLPGARAVKPDDAAALRAHLARVAPGDYLAICAFFTRSDVRHDRLQRIRAMCRDRLRVATTLGYGPRFLHSTGQLHKGGPATGVFVQLVADVGSDLPVPGEPFTFGVLRDAQGLGDFQVLEKHGRRALRVHLGGDVEAGLERLLASVSGA
jgi:RpiB/LacA/LacB family sugar-phosphate isomerase